MASPSRRKLSPEQREVRRQQRRASHRSSTYQAFLKDLVERAQVEPRVAEGAAVSVLAALEQRIVQGEGRHLEAQLPARLRELLQRAEQGAGASKAGKARRVGLRQFLARVAGELSLPEERAEPLVRSVLETLADHVSPGELEQVVLQLPQTLRSLWPTPLLARVSARQARPARPRQGGPSREGVRQVVEQLYALPQAAQLGVLRTVVPQVLRGLSEPARLSFWRDLAQAVGAAVEGAPVYDVRPGEGAGL